MAEVLFNGMTCGLYGNLPETGVQAPAFALTGSDLSEIKLSNFAGKNVILNVFPSLDTPVCASSVRKFNQEAASLPNTQVICVSMDLPFAMSRFCTAEGIENLKVASAFRSPVFGKAYGLVIENGPLRGLLARCVIVIDTKGIVKYIDLVGEITEEPDYQAILEEARKL
ncbi:MAG: thiol peroxidase [Muribaculaceae bacterium]|nr:thiol peroxidase [Muribaculaceae bacterium]